MSSLGERLRLAREKAGLKQVDVMRKTGINNKTLSGYENDVSEPDYNTLKTLADLYSVTIAWLFGDENTGIALFKQNQIGISENIVREPRLSYSGQTFEVVPIPILGTIHAGESMYAEQNIIGCTAIPENMSKRGNFFALRVIGDCMAGGRKPIEEGDIVIVREQAEALSGKIAVVLWPEVSEAQLRRIYYRGDQVVLRPDNPEYVPEVVSLKDIRIIGVVEAIQALPAAAKEI